MNRIRARILPFLVAAIAAMPARAQVDDAVSDVPAGVYIIYDSSNSMWGELADGARKYEVARDVLQDFLGQDFAGKDLAFRAYGHRRADDCRDSELIAAFGPPADVAATVRSLSPALTPKGRTPIDWSLREALKDFGTRAGDIILISDGIESCDADPCALVEEWRDKNVAIRVHVVGLGLDDKARVAMQCIAEASGTDYRDAASAEELMTGLREIREASGDTVFDLEGRLSDGAEIAVNAYMTNPDGERSGLVGSDDRIVTAPGTHSFEVGMLTRNGTLYRPVTLTAEALAGRLVTVTATVEEPPQVSARFDMAGDEASGANIVAYRDGEEAFSFRPIDTVYVEEGTYEFRSEVGDQSLSVTESLNPGDKKTIVFALEKRVDVVLSFIASVNGEDVGDNYELVRNGDVVAFGHKVNGANVAPGMYELRFRNELTPFVIPAFAIPENDISQEVVVPTGEITVRYVKADGTPAKDNGYFIARLDEEGRERGSRVHRSETRRAFLPGRYRISARGTETKDIREIDLQEGEKIEIEFVGD